MKALATTERERERDEGDRIKYFYLAITDASGKTYLFNVLHVHLNIKNIMTSTADWIQIDATLLMRRKAFHFLIKLPDPLTETRFAMLYQTQN